MHSAYRLCVGARRARMPSCVAVCALCVFMAGD